MEDEDHFKCNLCSNAYKYQGTLKTHIMVSHCKSYTYDCNHCEYHRSSVDSTEKQPCNGDPFKVIKLDTERGLENRDGVPTKGSFSKESLKVEECTPAVTTVGDVAAKPDVRHILARVILWKDELPYLNKINPPEKIILTKAEQKVKVAEIEQFVKDENSWMSHFQEFISNIEDTRLVRKLQFAKLIDIRSLRRNHGRNYGSKCPVYLAPILVIQKHRSNSGSRMNLQEWEDCLMKIVTYSNFKKKDADYLTPNKEKTQLLQKRRKRGAIAKMKTIEMLKQADEEGIELYVRGERLPTITESNLTEEKASFSYLERKHLMSPLNNTLAMRQDGGTTVIEKKPSEALKELIKKCLKEGATREGAIKQIKARKSQTRKPKENRSKQRRIFKTCQICYYYSDKEKIMADTKVREHCAQYHEESFMLEGLKENGAAIFPVVKIFH